MRPYGIVTYFPCCAVWGNFRSPGEISVVEEISVGGRQDQCHSKRRWFRQCTSYSQDTFYLARYSSRELSYTYVIFHTWQESGFASKYFIEALPI